MASKQALKRRRKPTRKAAKLKVAQQPVISGPVAAEWVVSMHTFFGVHGYYRSEDVRRVLGDPSKPFAVEEQDGLLTGSYTVHS